MPSCILVYLEEISALKLSLSQPNLESAYHLVDAGPGDIWVEEVLVRQGSGTGIHLNVKRPPIQCMSTSILLQ